MKQVDKQFIYAKTGNCEISLACDSELVLTFSKNDDKNSQFVYWILSRAGVEFTYSKLKHFLSDYPKKIRSSFLLRIIE